MESNVKRLGRWLIRSALLVAALAVLMALAVGLVLERFQPEAIAELDRRLPWTIAVERYERGWFSTEATLAASDRRGAVVWRHRARIEHGPWLGGAGALGWLGGEGTLEPADAEAAATIRWWVTPGLTAHGRVDLSPPGTPDGLVELELGERFSRLDVRLSGLSHAVPDAAGLERFDGSGWVTLGGPRIAAAFSLRGRRAFTPGAVIDGPDLDLTLQGEGDSVGLRLALVANHVSLDQSYRDLALELELERLHRPSLALSLDSAVRIAQADLAPEARAQQLGQALVLLLPGLLNHRPAIDLKRLRLDAPQGPVEASAAAALVRPPAAGYLAEPGRLLPALEASWEAVLPRALARRWLESHLAAGGHPPEAVPAIADELFARWDAEGLLVADGDRLSSRGRLADRVLTVNDRPRPLPEI